MVTERQKELAKRTYMKHRGEAIARSVARQAWLSGKIDKKPCEICGGKNVQAHHNDYNKPLEVRWLCTKHHREWHMKNEPIRPLSIRRCIICKKEFRVTKDHKKYCSKECRYEGILANNRKSNRKHYHPSTGSERACKECGKIFVPHGSICYCSHMCRREARLRQKREEYKRNKDKYRLHQKEYRKEYKWDKLKQEAQR